MDGMVAAKIQDNESRYGLLGSAGQIDEDVHTRPVFFASKFHRDLLTSSQAVQGLALQVKNLKSHSFRPANRCPSVNVFAEKLKNLRPTSITPHL